MDALDRWQAVVTFALAVVPWLLPDCMWYVKLILLLCIGLGSLGLYCLRITKRAKKISEHAHEIEQKHNALSIQFDEKVVQERSYKRIFSNLSIMLHMACQNTKDAKFVDIYRAFILAQSEIENGGNNNE